ncbi:hypothetical protein LUZ61_010510 [Rhynchospora tenuis]|uniref:Uncharacterized protein n=1 Tax=Rhynchospora tenuis TaxID=198213 RepID=A0AAD5ZZC7_9POAL|nr:hypothetical protein LUZ61_010510 [Rhynchospora tenuis]
MLVSKLALCLFLLFKFAIGEDPYRFFDWTITYGDINPLGIKQQGILINGQFPGPDIYSQTNDNLIINVHNNLPDPFLISWNGVQQRKDSWQDGVHGTNCPIPPGKNFTYHLHLKDQIGSFFYFPSLAFHKAAGGFGAIRILSRPMIPVPFPDPAGDFTVLIGDWYKTDHKKLQARLDRGRRLPPPDGVLINGRGPNGASFTVDEGKTYRLRISNVGLESSLNIRIEGHLMTLVEIEGTHTMKNIYDSIDVHLGQSLSVLITANQPVKDYYIAVSTRFKRQLLTITAVLHYSSSKQPVSGTPPDGPTNIDYSLIQARTFMTNLTASGPRPNPQGSYHYGSIPVTRTIRLANSAEIVNGKKRYAVNSVSFIDPDTPLKLADYFKINGVFNLGGITDYPTDAAMHMDTAVMDSDYHAFVELVFENREYWLQSWHLDGYSMFVVGMDRGQWSTDNRTRYNLLDAVPRCTVQVYPQSWTAVYVALDSVGMWNLRSETWARRYLGQQFYLRVYTDSNSTRDELPMPENALLCGRVAGKLAHT